MKNILSSWKTTLLGAIVLVAKIMALNGKICAADVAVIASGIGLILSKDADVTHSKGKH
jgi:hypothetical protein